MTPPIQDGVPEEALKAAGDRIATSPIKAVYQDADRIARVALRAALPHLHKAWAEDLLSDKFLVCQLANAEQPSEVEALLSSIEKGGGG